MKLYTYNPHEFENHIGRADCTQFDIKDSGAFVVSILAMPTPEEISNYCKDRVKISVTVVENEIFLICQIGDLPYFDAPYTLHLSNSISNLDNLRELISTFRVVLVDSIDGSIKEQNIYYLDDDFVEEFYAIIKDNYKLPFDKKAYFEKIKAIQDKYSTSDLLNMAIINFDSEESSDYTPDENQLSLFECIEDDAIVEEQNEEVPKEYVVTFTTDDGMLMRVPSTKINDFLEAEAKKRINKFVGKALCCLNNNLISLTENELLLTIDKEEIAIAYNEIYDIKITSATLFGKGRIDVILNNAYLDKASSYRPIIDEYDDGFEKRKQHKLEFAKKDDALATDIVSSIRKICNELHMIEVRKNNEI